MKKTEIIQLALIILGLSLIIRILINLMEQLSMFISISGEISINYLWVLIIIFLLTILILIGYFIITKSEIISKKIIKDENDSNLKISLDKSEVIHVSIVILSLYFLVKLFPSFINAFYIIILNFFVDYTRFRDLFPQQIWTLILYITILLILLNSRKFSIWLERKIMK
jgi:hypothetical protein